MSVLLLVLPLAFSISALAVWAFVWSVRGGQLDDLETPAERALLDDEALEKPVGPATESR